MNFTCIDFSYCYNHVQMGIVITKRSDVYIVAFHLLWIVALEPCSRNKYWLGRADGSCVWLFMWGLTWLGTIWPQGWELYKCSYVSINAYTHSTGTEENMTMKIKYISQSHMNFLCFIHLVLFFFVWILHSNKKVSDLCKVFCIWDNIGNASFCLLILQLL